MSEPMLNINFCGTRMQATRDDPPSIKVNPNKRGCLPIKTETVQARFVGDKTTKTALDEVIEKMNPVSADKPFFLKCDHPTDESSFNVILQSITN